VFPENCRVRNNRPPPPVDRQRQRRLLAELRLGSGRQRSVLAKLKRFADAKDAAKQAVKLSPDFGPAWALLGKLYFQDNQNAEAVDAFQKTAQLMPKDAEFWRSLAASYSKVNQPTKSQDAIKKSQEVTNTTPILRASPIITTSGGVDSSAPYRDLVTGTLQAFESADIDAILLRYSQKVVYRTYGVVDQAFIRTDLERYFARWPVTRTELKGTVKVVDTEKPDEKKVLFAYDFQASSPNRGASATGSAANEWWVWETPTGLKVFGESQKITRGYDKVADEFPQTADNPTTSSPSPVQPNRNNRPVYVVVAPASKGLNIRLKPNAQSSVVVKLHQGDRVFVEDGGVRNTQPPSTVHWQKVTTMNGSTGWMNAHYIAPKR
jgi:Bacterial SH3 domain/Tetratricopeptide repeat